MMRRYCGYLESYSLTKQKITQGFMRLGFYFSSVSFGIYSYLFGNYKKYLKEFEALNKEEQEIILQRVEYCNKLSKPFKKDENFVQIKKFFPKKRKAMYYFDLMHYIYYFPKNRYFSHLFGDVTHVPDIPSFVKSRPIGEDNANSVLLKLDTLRHFYMPKDDKKYQDKIAKIVWRGKAVQKSRIEFCEKFYDKVDFDIGCTSKISKHKPYHANQMSILEQRNYKFLLSLEGNDVASGLKWNMMSNSLVFMAKPKYETWFMEGRLKPDFHYVLVKDDYSDLEQKMQYYLSHEQEALKIISNANKYAQEFLDKKREKLINIMSIKKYFDIMK